MHRTILAGLLAASLAGLAGATPCDFFPGRQAVLQTNNNSRQLVAADLDGDGHQDLAVAGAWGLNVFLGRGDGSFSDRWELRHVITRSRRTAVGQAIGAGDLDGDGVSDVVLGYEWQREFGFFATMLGNGDGTFRLHGTYGPWYRVPPTRLVVEDFDGDGMADVATASNNGRGSLAVLKGDGSGGLAAPRVSGLGAEDLLAHDFDGDGILDVAVALNGGGFSVVRGRGDGAFSGVLFHHERVDYCEDWDGDGVDDECFVSPGRSLTLADVDGDDVPDLVVRSDDSWIDVLRGLGGGRFEPLAGTPGAPREGIGRAPVLVTDLDGDGRSDILDTNEAGHLLAILQQPDGSFIRGARYSGVGPSNISAAMADFDEDGRADVAAGTGQWIAVAFGEGTGRLSPDSRVVDRSMSVSVGDLDGDGDLDLVGVDRFSGYTVMENDGAGGFTRWSAGRTAFANPALARLADLDEDGRLDLVVKASANTLVVHPGNGDGTFGAYVAWPVGTRPNDLLVEDVDGDSHLDLVASNGSSHDVSVLLGRGDGTFETQLRTPVGRSPQSVAAGDVDGDGRIDLVTANRSDNDVSLLLGNGDGTFSDGGRLAVDRFPSQVTLGDVDADGRLDVLSVSLFGNLSLLLGHGDGSFAPESRVALASGAAGHPLLADLDLDGRLDIVVPNSLTSVLMGLGDGTFLEPRKLLLGSGPRGMDSAAADLNADGLVDLVLPAWRSGAMSILLNPGDTTPPEIAEVAFDGSCLWAPNHARTCIEDVAAQVLAQDDCDDEAPEVTVIACTASQADDGLGDGNTEGDCAISEDGRGVCLRAERSGLDREGRRYLVTVAATDRSGNVAVHEAVVTVHHDRRGGWSCR